VPKKFNLPFTQLFWFRSVEVSNGGENDRLAGVLILGLYQQSKNI